MMSEKICIEVNDISFSYAHIPVLEHVGFTVKAGEYLGIIGPNGGGKTTLLKIILGLLKPDSGDVKVFGRNTEEFKERYRIGYVPQKSAQAEFFFPATVEEVVRSGRTARIGILRRFSRKDNEAVDEAMETAGVSEYKSRLISRLSGGERQRVLIARSLAGGPSMLILDEPAVGVDIASQEKFYEFLAHLNSEQGITIIFVSHDVGVIAHEVNTILCLNHRMMCHGSPESFIKEEYLEKLYGRKVTSLHHRH
jgi:zinc transport system ATP-binding protein